MTYRAQSGFRLSSMLIMVLLKEFRGLLFFVLFLAVLRMGKSM